MSKVLFVCPTATLKSGGEKSNYQLIRYIRDAGHDVKVITSFRGDYNKTLTSDNIENKVIKYHWWTDEDWDMPKYIADTVVDAVESIVKEIDSFKPDVIVTNTLNVPWGALAASARNIPHIWIAREFSTGSFSYLDKKMSFINQYSNKIMANSEELAMYIKEKYGFKNVDHFYSYVDDTNLRLNPDVFETRIVSLNQINERKNQEDLIEAIAILKKQNPKFDTEVLLIGATDLEYKSKIDKQIKGHHLEDIIKFKGFLSEPWLKVGINDILVQTSKSESIGRTTTEAMKLGIPVIASDIAGHREAFSLGGGQLYKLGNPRDLANKINNSLKSHSQTKKDAAGYKARIKRTMSRDACCGPFVAAIAEVVEQPNTVGGNAQIEPFFRQHIENLKLLNKDREKLLTHKEEVIEELIKQTKLMQQSKSYRLGNMQVRLVKKIVRPFKELTKR